MGGGVLFQELLQAGQVDRVEVAVAPVLLGGGLPFLPALARRRRLTLSGTKQYPSGILLLEYAVLRDPS